MVFHIVQLTPIPWKNSSSLFVWHNAYGEECHIVLMKNLDGRNNKYQIDNVRSHIKEANVMWHLSQSSSGVQLIILP